MRAKLPTTHREPGLIRIALGRADAAAFFVVIEGVVRLEFRIGPDGRADMVRFLEGPGYGCGEAAERLIRKMPQWLPALENGIATTDRQRNIAIQFRRN